jgi:hypothetical protein
MALRVENAHELAIFVEFYIFYLAACSFNDQVKRAKAAISH